MISSINVTMDGVELVRYYSTNFKKIKCVEDGNIYPLAYATKDATVKFEETNIDLNEITSGAIVSASDVLGLSNYIAKTTEGQIGAISVDIAKNISGTVAESISVELGNDISTAIMSNISGKLDVSAENVIGLSDFIIDTMDGMDGLKDGNIFVDLGGA